MEIKTYPDFLTPEECAAFRAKIAEKNDADNFTDSGRFDNKMWRDAALADRIHTRLLALDPTAKDRYLRANNVVMAGHYEVGDSFSLHTDTGLYYDKERKEKSRWTLLIYLNDDFEGGETVFYHTDTWAETHRIRPHTGMALLFDIDLWHSGQPLLRGQKFWIGCEIIGGFHK